MIQLIEYHQIDFEKYNHCIKNSQYPVIYAESWYLDIVTNQDWKVLVYEDYQAVMPIPYARLKRSFWKKSIVQPYFCQQLGVFSQKEISQEVFDGFYSEIQKLKPLIYQFNFQNNEDLNNYPDLVEKKNYILPLKPSYQEIFESYRKDRKKDVKRSLKKELSITTFNDFDFYMKTIANERDTLNEKGKKRFVTLLNSAYEKNRLICKKLSNKNSEWMSMAIWLKSGKRMILLSSVRNKKTDEKGAFAYLIDRFISENAEKDLIFDFEGSDISGIEDFNKSFGAENQPYYCLK